MPTLFTRIMSLLQQQNFLAKVFTDENLREKFLSEPLKIGKQNDLSETEIEQICSMLPEQIKVFADSLFYKRLREVEKILPLTRKFLGESFESHFRRFAAGFVPQTIKKHLEDAIEFCELLKKSQSGWLKDVISFEQARVIFNGYGKNFVLKIFDYDIKKILEDTGKETLNNLPKRKTFAFWLKIGGRKRYFIW